MCRQINGCVNNVSERIQGSKGSTNCQNSILDLSGTELWKYQYPADAEGKPGSDLSVGPYLQEHIDLVTAIRTGKAINEAENTAISTMTAIMGRISAYTGKEVTYEEMMNSDLKLGPKVFEFGNVDVSKEVPVAVRTYGLVYYQILKNFSMENSQKELSSKISNSRCRNLCSACCFGTC